MATVSIEILEPVVSIEVPLPNTEIVIQDEWVNINVDSDIKSVEIADVGIQGPAGDQGIQGIKGDTGEKGDKGDKGDPGVGIANFDPPISFDGGTGTVGLNFDPTTLEVGVSGLTVIGAGNADTLDGHDSTYFLNTSATAQSKAGDLSLTGTGTMEILDLNEASMTAKVSTISSPTALLIDSFVAANYRSAEYILQFSQGSLNYSMSKLMLIHDGTDVAISEYGHVEVGTPIPYTFNAAFSLGNLEITVSCSNANITSVNLKFSRVLFDV